MNIFVFDIETIPDTHTGRKLYNLDDSLSDADVAKAMFTLKRQQSGSDFLALHMHQIVAISVVLYTPKFIKVWSLGDEDANEAELLTRFFNGLDQFSPFLVSWNGSGFDLPVIHYRSLLHGISSPTYWDTGSENPEFRWNNYLNRYHYRHMDIMDILAAYQARANAPLDQIATMLGFPGKMGMHGAKVWEYYQQGDLQAIRNYCETDVLNTYLVYLRFELMRATLDPNQYQERIDGLRSMLREEDKPHLTAFLNEWQ